MSQDLISDDPTTHGAMFVPIVLGSDATTVSVATGQNDFYPLYASIGNVRNNVRRAHRDAVAIIGFLAIPKGMLYVYSQFDDTQLKLAHFTADKKHEHDALFWKFRRQLFHSSLSAILQTLRPGMTTPEVTLCPDGHFRRAIYGLGPYIADYPEQVLLACIVQGWCARYVFQTFLHQLEPNRPI